MCPEKLYLFVLPAEYVKIKCNVNKNICNEKWISIKYKINFRKIFKKIKIYYIYNYIYIRMILFLYKPGVLVLPFKINLACSSTYIAKDDKYITCNIWWKHFPVYKLYTNKVSIDMAVSWGSYFFLVVTHIPIYQISNT